MRKAVTFTLTAFLVCPVAPCQVRPFEELVHLYDYDSKAQLDIQETKVVDRDGVKVHDITYASPKGGRVPAFLVVPGGKGPFAGVVFLHWGQGDRSSFLAEALMLARVGAVSLVIDAPFVRPEPWRHYGDFAHPEAERDSHIQAIVDVRRGVDLLTSRPDVDPKRLAYVGHSYGASLGGAIAAVEKRFRAAVLMAGLPSWTETYRTGANAGAREARDSVPKERFETWLAIIGPLDALNYIGHVAPTALFFQFARADRFIPQRMAEEYVEAASEPKSLQWYEGGHEFNDPAALRDRAEWLRKQIGIRSLQPVLKKKLGLR